MPKGKKQGKEDPKPPKMSALDAAAKVLADAETPINCQEMIDAMSKAKLWSSPNGQTCVEAHGLIGSTGPLVCLPSKRFGL